MFFPGAEEIEVALRPIHEGDMSLDEVYLVREGCRKDCLCVWRVSHSFDDA